MDVALEDIVVPSGGNDEFHNNLFLIPSSRHLANLSKLLILSENEVKNNVG